MSNLFARFAKSLFWLGRHRERAENTAHIVHVNEACARDKPSGPGWGDLIDLFSDRVGFEKAGLPTDAPGVLNFNILVKTSPISIEAALINGRENARKRPV